MNAFSRVFSYLKYEKKYTICAIFAVIVETVFELVIPLIMSNMINEGISVYINNPDNVEIKNNAFKVIYLSAAGIGICAFMSLVCGWIYSIFASRAASNFGHTIRKAQFESIQNYSFTNLDSFEPSSLVTRVINDSMFMQNTFQQTLRQITRSPIMLILGISFAFYYSWKFAVIFLILTPFLALVIIGVLRYVTPKYKVLQNKLDGLNSKIEENLVAIRAIKSFVRKPYECDLFDNVNKDYKDIVIKTYKVSNLILPVFQAVMYTSTILFLYFGSTLIINNELKPGDLTGILSYVMQTFNSLIMLSNVFVAIAKSLASTYRIGEVLNVTPDLISGEEMNKVDDSDIEFKNVSFKYKQGSGDNVLSNISFKLESGKTLGILGATGSAKSTLVSLIPRLYDVSSGEILIGDNNVKTYDLVDLRNNISYVLQSASLFEGTVLDNLKWAKKDISEEELNKALSISCVDEYLHKLSDGLNTNIGVSGNNLSGGQKQRLCLARAILKNPKILILDDSTSAVDTKTEKKIRTGLRSLEGMTKIIISQRILSVLEADYVLILENGKINEFNTPKELLEHNHIFQDLYDRQLKGVDLSE